MFYRSLPVYFLMLGAALCAPEHMPDHDPPTGARADIDMGKRAYSYVSEYKRLPVYNFGLGKRSRPVCGPPYDFGIGKRSVDAQLGEPQEDDSTNDLDPAALAALLERSDDEAGYEKRARPYSFGLGKRFVDEDTNEEKRARMYDFGLGKRLPLYNFGLGKRARSYNFGLGKRFVDDETSEEKRARMYDFGLGKRLPLYNFGLGKRARSYNFGLGKRLSSKFNFGLGKRERDMNRFSFGLGKRSIENSADDTENLYDV